MAAKKSSSRSSQLSTPMRGAFPTPSLTNSNGVFDHDLNFPYGGHDCGPDTLPVKIRESITPHSSQPESPMRAPFGFRGRGKK